MTNETTTDGGVLREVCLDTETTGLRADKKDRVIEIGAVELIDRQLTGNTLHLYFNPEVESIDAKAVAVHGLTVKRLENEPLFRECIDEIIEFIQGAHLVMHNAPFDVGFLNAEMKRVRSLNGKTVESFCPTVIDTLEIAQAMRPGKGNSLDDLRDFYEITDKREHHGALIDARILAKVYLRMTSVQDSLDLNSAQTAPSQPRADLAKVKIQKVGVSKDEQKLHEFLMNKIKARDKIDEEDFRA